MPNNIPIKFCAIKMLYDLKFTSAQIKLYGK